MPCRSEPAAGSLMAVAPNRPPGLDERADRRAECPQRLTWPGRLGGRNHARATSSGALAARCTPATARPDGSAAVANPGSQAIAAADEHAIDGPPGTVSAQQ